MPQWCPHPTRQTIVILLRRPLWFVTNKDFIQIFFHYNSYVTKKKTKKLFFFPLTKNAEGKTQMEVNIEKRHTDNVIFSFDRSRHAADRQTSREYKETAIEDEMLGISPILTCTNRALTLLSSGPYRLSGTTSRLSTHGANGQTGSGVRLSDS